MLPTMFVVLAIVTVLTSGQQFKCPSTYGEYADPHQCDKYYVCQNGVAEEKLCEDGLVFDAASANKPFPVGCTFPVGVDCEGRPALQPAQSTVDCPRSTGFFQHKDPKSCHRYVACFNGIAEFYTCPSGLVYYERKGVCATPEEAGRTGCVREDEFQPYGKSTSAAHGSSSMRLLKLQYDLGEQPA